VRFGIDLRASAWKNRPGELPTSTQPSLP